MISLPIISIIFCFAYVFFILFKYGVPVSISETYYLLPNKWDWLFSGWTVLTSVPFAIYWFSVAPPGLKWIPIVVAIALLMVGVADCYKSGPKREVDYVPTLKCGEPHTKSRISGLSRMTESSSFWNKIKEILKNFDSKEFFKYGPARLIHYVNSLLAIILSSVYICLTGGIPGIMLTVLSYVVFIAVGLKVDGVYNSDYSADVDNKAWIFFMEIVCLINLFVFIFV